jgi:hypothetical protein
MSRSNKAGGSRLRAAFVTAVAALTVSAIGASAAQADTIILDHGSLKIAGNEDPFEVITPANAVTLTTSALPGAFTIANTNDVNEIQTITETGGNVTGGTYTITFDGETTDPLDFNDPLTNGDNPTTGTPDDIAEALGRLPNLEYFDIKLGGGPLPDTPLTLEFVGAEVYASDQPQITVDSSALTGGGTYNTATSQVSGAKSAFDFPQFEGDLGFALLAVDVKPTATVNGTYTAASGTMTTVAQNYVASVAVGPPLNVSCNYTVNLAFSTADNSVYRGDLFDLASNPPVNGAITDDWSTLPGAGGPCAPLDGFTAGPGALWLSNGVATPTLVPKPVGGGTPPVVTPKCTKKQKLVKGKCVKKKKKKKKKKKT